MLQHMASCSGESGPSPAESGAAAAVMPLGGDTPDGFGGDWPANASPCAVAPKTGWPQKAERPAPELGGRGGEGFGEELKPKLCCWGCCCSWPKEGG